MNLTFFINRVRGIGFTTIKKIQTDLSTHDKRATGDLIEKTRFEIMQFPSLISIQFKAPAYWINVDQGRKKGKFPPPAPILKWIKKKGIASGKEAQRAVFPISKAIAMRGIPATNIYTNAIKNFKNQFITNAIPALSSDIQKEARQALRS